MRVIALVAVLTLAVAGCSGKEPLAGPQEPSGLALSVQTSPSPIPFSLLPPRVPPGEPLPPCCQTLMAGWSIELRANAESRLESISAVLRSGSVEFGQASLDPPWQGPIRLVPGGSLILAQRLLATMPASLPDSFYLRVHLDVSMENGYRRKIDLDMPLTRSGS